MSRTRRGAHLLRAGAVSLSLASLFLVGCGGGSTATYTDAEREQRARAEVDRLFKGLKTTDPLPPDQLATLLPKAPTGWQAQEPETKVERGGTSVYTDAWRVYGNNDYSVTGTIRIRDTGGNPYWWAAFQGDVEDSSDEKRGITVKTTELDGFWARELTYKQPKSCVIVSMVGRFAVRVETLGIDLQETENVFWKSIDKEALKKATAQ